MGKYKFKDENYDEKLERDMKMASYKRKCKHCGWNNIVFNKEGKVLCKVCKNYVYLNDKDEFKDKLKSKIKKVN